MAASAAGNDEAAATRLRELAAQLNEARLTRPTSFAPQTGALGSGTLDVWIRDVNLCAICQTHRATEKACCGVVLFCTKCSAKIAKLKNRENARDVEEGHCPFHGSGPAVDHRDHPLGAAP